MIHLHLLCLYSKFPMLIRDTLLKPKSKIEMKPFIVAIKLIFYMFTASRQGELSVAFYSRPADVS